MASSSSSQPRSSVSPKLYDVFISHRGPDVKDTLAKQLYDLLKARDCKAFLDREEIEGGDSIPSAIHNAICSSRVQIAVFSKGYAESYWCLDELVLMLEQTDNLFIPVFYGVKPGELRYIENGKSQYAAAFADYQSKSRNLDKLDGWKRALAAAADISGYELSQYQQNLCDEIVSRVEKEMKKWRPLYVAKYPVGLAELVQDFVKSCPETAQTVGIYGLGGIGKSTLARELFNWKRSSYSASCFLSDVRECHARGNLHSLQSQLLKDLFREEWSRNSVYEGIEKLKDNLGRVRHLNLHFLVVLDDIDHQDQMDALLPEDMSSSGSLVIITTRDKSVLRGADSCYKMKGIDEDRAKALFCSHAFRGRTPPTEYERLVESFVKFCGGLPLSLIVLGAHVYGRGEHYWELELEKVKKIQPKDIERRLKISFDGLDREEKQIFIDIACFFNKNTYGLVTRAIIIWKASGWSDEHALQTLKDKCLVDVNQYSDTFEMHDHLRDLGRHMAEELGPPRLWRPELLRSMEAKGFEQILADTKDRCFHSYSDSSLQRKVTYFIAEAHLLWFEMYPIDEKSKISIPSWIPLHKLQILEVDGVLELWSSFHQHLQTNSQASFELRRLSIWNSPSLLMLPEMFSNLEELKIGDSLDKTDTISFVQSLKQLRNLRSLHLFSGYWSRTGFYSGHLMDLSEGRNSSNFNSSTSSRLDRLETIRLENLSNMYKLVISGEMCPRLRSLVVTGMKGLNEMELIQLESLITLQVEGCLGLETLSGFSSLRRLEKIFIGSCPELQGVEGLEELPRLESMMIDMPEHGYAWVRNYIHGLRKLPVKEICLIHGGVAERWVSLLVAVYRASCQLNANLFSEVISAEAVSEIEERWDDTLQIESSSSAITIYALLISQSHPRLFKGDPRLFKGEDIYHEISGVGSYKPQIYTFLLNQHDSEWRLENVRIKKGYKATVKVGEEEKALTVLQRIVDRICKLKLGVYLDDMGTDVSETESES